MREGASVQSRASRNDGVVIGDFLVVEDEGSHLPALMLRMLHVWGVFPNPQIAEHSDDFLAKRLRQILAVCSWVRYGVLLFIESLCCSQRAARAQTVQTICFSLQQSKIIQIGDLHTVFFLSN